MLVWVAAMLATRLALATGGEVLMMPAYFVPSHRLVMYRLAEELARRGHHVTVWELGLKPVEQQPVAFPQVSAPPGPLPRREQYRHLKAPNLTRLYWQVDVPDRHVQLAHRFDNASVYNVVWSDAVVEPARRAATWHMAQRLCEQALVTRRADFDALVARRFDAVLLDDLYAPCGLLHVGTCSRTWAWARLDAPPQACSAPPSSTGP